MGGAVHFIGVDGGGTRCRVRARDATGQIHAEAERGSANVHSNPDEALATIVAALKDVQQHVGDSVQHIGLGLAGIYSAAGASAMAERLRSQVVAHSVTVDTDALTACLGAHNGADGGIVIVGTGSAAMVLAKGARHEFGGWGLALGDQGSGAVIGRSAVRHAICTKDGVIPIGPLAELVLARLPHDRAAIIGWAVTARPADYGQFVPFVVAAAEAGDAAALEILAAATDDVAAMVARVLTLGAPVFSLVGGLASVYRDRLPPELASHHQLPKSDAVDGAIFLARQAAGLTGGML
jgi:glucosamine kinase